MQVIFMITTNIIIFLTNKLVIMIVCCINNQLTFIVSVYYIVFLTGFSTSIEAYSLLKLYCLLKLSERRQVMLKKVMDFDIDILY